MWLNVRNVSVWNGDLRISNKGISGDFPITQTGCGRKAGMRKRKKLVRGGVSFDRQKQFRLQAASTERRTAYQE
jgi:hypothetical protein